MVLGTAFATDLLSSDPVNQPTPAIVAQHAVRRLPRLALILLCAAYVLPGFWGRAPWKSNDIESFPSKVGLSQLIHSPEAGLASCNM